MINNVFLYAKYIALFVLTTGLILVNSSPAYAITAYGDRLLVVVASGSEVQILRNGISDGNNHYVTVAEPVETLTVVRESRRGQWSTFDYSLSWNAWYSSLCGTTDKGSPCIRNIRASVVQVSTKDLVSSTIGQNDDYKGLFNAHGREVELQSFEGFDLSTVVATLNSEGLPPRVLDGVLLQRKLSSLEPNGARRTPAGSLQDQQPDSPSEYFSTANKEPTDPKHEDANAKNGVVRLDFKSPFKVDTGSQQQSNSYSPTVNNAPPEGDHYGVDLRTDLPSVDRNTPAEANAYMPTRSNVPGEIEYGSGALEPIRSASDSSVRGSSGAVSSGSRNKNSSEFDGGWSWQADPGGWFPGVDESKSPEARK